MLPATPSQMGQRVIKKVVPIPSIPKPIHDEDGQEDDVPLNRRTQLARAT